MASSDNVPGYGADAVSGERQTQKVSGTADSGDATLEPGQYPVGSWGNELFGGPLPAGTGAPGSQGAKWNSGTDPTNEPGQTEDGITGISEAEITRTGAPGTAGAANSLGSGSDSVTFTRPGSPYSGTYTSDTVRDDVSGSSDWTGANDGGYSSGGPQLPAIKGNEPEAGSGRFQPGSGGRVLRGGRSVRG